MVPSKSTIHPSLQTPTKLHQWTCCFFLYSTCKTSMSKLWFWVLYPITYFLVMRQSNVDNIRWEKNEYLARLTPIQLSEKTSGLAHQCMLDPAYLVMWQIYRSSLTPSEFFISLRLPTFTPNMYWVQNWHDPIKVLPRNNKHPANFAPSSC